MFSDALPVPETECDCAVRRVQTREMLVRWLQIYEILAPVWQICLHGIPAPVRQICLRGIPAPVRQSCLHGIPVPDRLPRPRKIPAPRPRLQS